MVKDIINEDSLEAMMDKYKGGLFDLPQETKCYHPSHNPPMHLYIPYGKTHRHECPSCGRVIYLKPPQITF